jgi:hypothetical protein
LLDQHQVYAGHRHETGCHMAEVVESETVYSCAKASPFKSVSSTFEHSALPIAEHKRCIHLPDHPGKNFPHRIVDRDFPAETVLLMFNQYVAITQFDVVPLQIQDFPAPHVRIHRDGNDTPESRIPTFLQ